MCCNVGLYYYNVTIISSRGGGQTPLYANFIYCFPQLKKVQDNNNIMLCSQTVLYCLNQELKTWIQAVGCAMML